MMSATIQQSLGQDRQDNRVVQVRNLKGVRILLCGRLECAASVGRLDNEVRTENILVREETSEEDRQLAIHHLNAVDRLKKHSSECTAIDLAVLSEIVDSQVCKGEVVVGSAVLFTINGERGVCVLTPRGVSTPIDNNINLKGEQLTGTFVSVDSPFGMALKGRRVGEPFRYCCDCGVCEAEVLEIA